MKYSLIVTLATGGVALVLALIVGWFLNFINVSALVIITICSMILLFGVLGVIFWPVLNNSYTNWWERKFKL